MKWYSLTRNVTVFIEIQQAAYNPLMRMRDGSNPPPPPAQKQKSNSRASSKASTKSKKKKSTGSISSESSESSSESSLDTDISSERYLIYIPDLKFIYFNLVSQCDYTIQLIILFSSGQFALFVFI